MQIVVCCSWCGRGVKIDGLYGQASVLCADCEAVAKGDGGADRRDG